MIPLDLFVQWYCTVLNKQATGMSSNPLPFAGFTYTRKGCPENQSSQHAAYKHASGQAAAFCPYAKLPWPRLFTRKCALISGLTLCDLHSPAVINAPEAC